MKVLVIARNAFSQNGISNVIINYYMHIHNNIRIDAAVCDAPEAKLESIMHKRKSKVYILPRKSKHLLSYLVILYKILRKREYEVVHIHECSADILFEVIIAKICGIKNCIVHSHSTSCNHKILHNICKIVLKKIKCTRIACSDAAGKWMYGNKEYTILNNGINADELAFDEKRRDETRKEYGFEDNFVIGHVGGFYDVKNHGFLIDVFEKIYIEDNKYRLILVGDGAEIDRIKELVIKKNLENAVLFVGSVTDVKKYLWCMDIFVFPSKYEGVPLALIEAQASGLACVISDTVALEGVFSEETISLSLEDSISTWSDTVKQRIESCMKNRKVISKQSINNIKSNNYDISMIAENLLTLYRS